MCNGNTKKGGKEEREEVRKKSNICSNKMKHFLQINSNTNYRFRNLKKQ